MATEIQRTVKEMVLSNRVIVRQLREVISNGSQCSCPCHTDQQREDNSKTLQELEDKLDECDILTKAFLDKQDEHETEIEKLQSANNDLDTKLEELKELTSKDNGPSSDGDESDDEWFECESEPKEMESNITGERTLSENSHPGGSRNRLSVDTIKQVRQLDDPFIVNIDEWILKAQAEKDRAVREAPGPVNGVATVICLDISANMIDNGAWNHAYQFIMEYIEGLERMTTHYGITEEHVALVTFGNKTEVVERLTNNYAKIKSAFNNVSVHVGGPSPMLGGLVMSASALQISMRSYDINGIVVFNKIVLITDGNPTDVCKIAGPDTVSRPDDEMRETSILNFCQELCDEGDDLFCVPCGNANMDFLTRMVEKSDGKIVKHTEGKWLSKRTFMTFEAAKSQFNLSPILSTKKPTDQAQEEMLQIIARSRKKVQEIQIKGLQEMYRDTNSPNLPPVGSRVQRGPEWARGDSDKYKLGIVIGHSHKEGTIWVDWRIGEIFEVRYGYDGRYEVLIVDEYVKLSETFIMGVGCEVVPGPQWKSLHINVKRGMSGTAIKLDLQRQVVQVKWKNGERGEYTYVRGKQEVILANIISLPDILINPYLLATNSAADAFEHILAEI